MPVDIKRPGDGRRKSEYCDLGDRTWARSEFLEAIRRTAPEVLETLREEVLPHFSALDLKSHPDYEHYDWSLDRVSEVLAKLRHHLEPWADRFNLRRPTPEVSLPPWDKMQLFQWMGPIIVSTLLDWDKGLNLDPLSWAFVGNFSNGAHCDFPDAFKFETDGWSTLRETEEDFKVRLQDEFVKKMTSYIARQKREAERLGWILMPPRVAPEHFDWLVLFQIKRVSQERIAKAAHRTRPAVAEAIQKTAGLVAGDGVQFWLRPALPPGRRRKSS
jgi:hypothetical protein